MGAKIFRLYFMGLLTSVLASLSISPMANTSGTGGDSLATFLRAMGAASAFAWGTNENWGDCECDCPPCSDVSPPTSEGWSSASIDAGSGNLFLRQRDYTGGPGTGLSFTRVHNSNSYSTGIQTNAGPGYLWNSEWHRKVAYYGVVPPQAGNVAYVARKDGRQYRVTATDSAGSFSGSPDMMERFSLQLDTNHNIISAKFVTADDAVELYVPTSPIPPSTTTIGATLNLTKITERNGRVTTISRNTTGEITKVTGPFGHELTFSYPSGVTRMTTPDGGVYSYSAISGGGNPLDVTYPDGSLRRYLYELPTTTGYGVSGIVDESGNRFATFGYTSRRATSVTNAGGIRQTTLSFNADSTTTVTDARGNAHTYSFTTPFALTKPNALSGAPVQSSGGKAFTYDANGFVASRTDWNGIVTTYTHDSRGNETSRTEASGTPLARTVTTTWHASFHLPTRIVEPNRTTDFAYDAKGNLLTKAVTADGVTRSKSFTYNSLGQMLTATDPRGNVTTFAYGAKGNLTSVRNALGHETRYTAYDLNGRPLTIVDPNGVTTSLTYDLRGRLTSVAKGALKTTYVYDAVGNLTKATLPDNSFLIFSYDAAHRLIGVADALGNRVAYTLDLVGNLTKVQAFDPANVQTSVRSYAYDTVNRLLRAIGAQNETTAYAYDSQGNLTGVTDPLLHVTSYAYDAHNRLAQMIDANGRATSMTHDAMDHLTSVTDPRDLKTVYAWDGFDNQTSRTSPDAGLSIKTFDAAGNMTSASDGRSRRNEFAYEKTVYQYDALNRRTSATYSDGTSVTWRYDQGVNGIGRLTATTDSTGSTFYSYDANGHVTRKQQSISGVTRTTLYGYDSGGRLASITYPSGKQVVYTYDAAGRVLRLATGGQFLIKGAIYTPFGGARGWTYGNGAIYSRTFDQNNRISYLRLPAGKTMTLTYDTAGRITRIGDNVLGQKTFAYDALDRLVYYKGGALTQNCGYDVDDNRVSARLQDGVADNAFTYAFAATSNLLLSVDGAWKESFAYDAAGGTTAHVTPLANYAFNYNARGRLARSTTGALTRRHWINALGQRTLKTNPSNVSENTTFVYDEDGRLIGEYGPTGNVIQETVWLGDLPVATLQPSGAYFVAPDHLGAPRQITNSTDSVVWRWDHDPFGNGAPTGGVTFNLRFPGQYYDSESGLHYNGFRDYDPRTGRYIESDPAGLSGGVNSYVYARNNPVNYIDRAGLAFELYLGYSDAMGTPGQHIELFGYDTASGETFAAGGRGGVDPTIYGDFLWAAMEKSQINPNIPDFGDRLKAAFPQFNKVLKIPCARVKNMKFEEAMKRLQEAIDRIHRYPSRYFPLPYAYIPFVDTEKTANSNTAAAEMLHSLGIPPSVALSDPGVWAPGLNTWTPGTFAK